MTSDIDALKTNEFLRRRKLRLQQVREQSKDIAKKIRQRAKVEKLRHAVESDSNKEKEYFECQEKFVKRLEQLYAKGLQNVGAGHKNALESTSEDTVEKTDLSKSRGREAVAELRKKKQEKLDEQKKILDRKLQAREVANEISREKSNHTKNLPTKTSKKLDNDQEKIVNDIGKNNPTETIPVKDNTENPDGAKNDMGTQWECEDLPNEWEHVPALSLPKDDSVKDLFHDKCDKSKRPNLFALSEEMPSSLRGGLTSVTEEVAPLKPSLTLISDYLLNRNLRLRQSEPSSSKKSTEDLQSIRQTILRTRATKTDGRVLDTVCHVLDEQVIPVPSWQAGDNILLNKFKDGHDCSKSSRITNNNFPTSPRSPHRRLLLSPHSKSLCLSKRVKSHATCRWPVSGSKDKSSRSTEPDISLARKKSVSVYNHNTRDVQDVPCNDEGLVVRDDGRDDDAYAQAYKETAIVNNMEKDQINKRQKDMRNKVAITRQNVDKEYRDTLAFLNSLPKDTGNRPIRTAYMNDDRQQLQNDRHQRKMQQEFRRIEKECYKHSCKHAKRKTTVSECRSKSKSPVNNNLRKEFEYSWMPVPESDGSLAIHTIPTKNKSGNTVKFGQDSYHEYRSRHKHTPPTKDNERKKVVETVIVHNKSSNESSVASETSSVDDLSIERSKEDLKLKDAERIIIYKILESKKDRKCKHRKSEVKNKPVAEEDIKSTKKDDKKYNAESVEKSQENVQRGVSFEELREGVYKAVNKDSGDNVTSLYYTEDLQESDAKQIQHKTKIGQACCAKNSNRTHSDRDLQKNDEDNQDRSDKRRVCVCDNNVSRDSGLVQPSAATSASSFKTAANDKGNGASEAGFLKFIDEGGQETGKFYIGASGFIKDDDYEVVIQLRKKEGERAKNKQATVSQEVKELDTASKSASEELNQISLEEKCQDVSINTEEESPKGKPDDERKVHQKDQMEAKDSTIKTNNPSTCEKAVHTSFQDAFAVPDDAPKIDPAPRPATSAYTQTSFNSSIPRPVFMHMSSSTSTAYMSPPELILPKFLRQDYVMSYDTFDSENTTTRDEQYAKKKYRCHEQCACKRCACSSDKTNIDRRRNEMKTPPNTARSTRKCGSAVDKDYNECKRSKCRKCLSRASSKHTVCRKSNRSKSNYSLNKRTLKNLSRGDHIPSTTQTPPYKLLNSNARSKASGAKLNPVVKNYVNQLLSLNREGHKAIEIINEDCSSVRTPGSSIINVADNACKDSALGNKISLEEIKNMLKQRILKDISNCDIINANRVKSTECQTERLFRYPKKKSVHKVKSLNISKRLHNKNKPVSNERLTRTSVSSSSSIREMPKDIRNVRSRSKSSPTPRPLKKFEYNNNTSSDTTETRMPKESSHKITSKQSNTHSSVNVAQSSRFRQNKEFSVPIHRAVTTSMSSDSGLNSFLLNNIGRSQFPTNTCTQTNEIVDAEANFMKLAENKLQNMEKIADLTEKCTKRLSNLAKVLEEVRRNKSSLYSQISTSDSASESDKNGKRETGPIPVCISDPNVSVQNKSPAFSVSPTIPQKPDDKQISDSDHIEFTPFLKDIPRPEVFKSDSNTSLSVASEKSDQGSQPPQTPTKLITVKYKNRPPPALNRINLKHAQDPLLTPHELSTVVEVESPMSLKIKNQSSQDVHMEVSNKFSGTSEAHAQAQTLAQDSSIVAPEVRSLRESRINPDLLQSNFNMPRGLSKVSSNDSSDDSKMRMMDMKQFNDIMLKPFISLQEYAKQCNIGLEDGSNTEDILKDDPGNDELSSLHSDGSLPDVIAELLKRNIIAEPFKFDSASNINSTTLSSESTISMLALSKVRRDKKKSVLVRNKENIAETSETLSISSNPDLEKAFQKLGMGWASSTLKKTKERLALSSSSSASSSSLSQFRIRSFSQNVPTLGTDSSSSLVDMSKNHDRRKSPSKHPADNPKNAVQQTSLTNSMTVKEFLTNNLAKKITFNNKSSRKEADPEFVSLYETKMPDEMKNATGGGEDESSVASVNRARTSTPVQIFKSTTYRSTSSSNTSNGLFSNADDLSSVKGTSNSIRNHSTSDKDDLTIPNCSLKTKKEMSDRSD